MTEPTDIQVISKFFFDKDVKTTEKMAALKALTAEDKKKLAAGIRDGSLTY